MEGDPRQSWFVQWMVVVVIVFIVYIDWRVWHRLDNF